MLDCETLPVAYEVPLSPTLCLQGRCLRTTGGAVRGHLFLALITRTVPNSNTASELDHLDQR